ncbi:hypothetical protein JW968_00535 [Candidatus Woesearchaeota archaeon]|nr:hypothetical protein [Candidatus Woesearchaeota archaeon]
MPKITIINEAPLSLNDVRSEIKAIKKRDTELNARAQKVEEYVNTFLILKQKEAKDISKAIEDLNIPRLKELHIKKIIDMMPTSVDELKSILQGYPISVTNDNIKKIVDVTKKFMDDYRTRLKEKKDEVQAEESEQPDQAESE